MPLPRITATTATTALAAIAAALRDPRRWRRWFLELLIISAVITGVSLWQNRDLPAGVAPPLTGMRSDGSTIKVGPGATAQLVVFWGTWCPVCRAEEGNIAAIAKDWPVISVAVQSGDVTTVRHYLKSRDITLPAVIDAGGFIAADWNVSGVPAHFIIDPSGTIRFRVVGYATTLGLRARLWWAERFPR